MTLSSEGLADAEHEVVRITLRIPKVLHERIVEASGQRSMNAEIVRRLYSSFPLRAEEKKLHLEHLRNSRTAASEQVERLTKRIADLDAELARLQTKTA